MKSPGKCGAVVVYKQKDIPGLLSLFSVPEIKERHEITFENLNYSILIIEYPVRHGDLRSRRKNKLLSGILKDNSVEYVIERHLTEKGVYSTGKYDLPEEIRAVKLFKAVQKLSELTGKNYMNGSFGFITSNWEAAVGIFSDEAVNIMIYDSSKLDSKMKNQIYNDYMTQKGISIVFTRDMDKIVKTSDILFVDPDTPLESCSKHLKGKLVFGENNCCKETLQIEKVLMWQDFIQELKETESTVAMNDELLAILRYFNMDKSYVKFADSFEHVYLYNSRDKWY